MWRSVSQQTVAWNKADRERARNAPPVRLSTNKQSQLRNPPSQNATTPLSRPSLNDGKDWEWGRAGARVPVRRLPPSGLLPSCGCGLETWFVVIGPWPAGFGTTTRRELARKIKPNPNGKKACWVGWLCAVYGWLVLSRHPQPIPSLDGFPGSADILHGAIGPRSRVGLIEGREGCVAKGANGEKSPLSGTLAGSTGSGWTGSIETVRVLSRRLESVAQHATAALSAG